MGEGRESVWLESHRADARAKPLADRHYNRQNPNSAQFAPPGRTLVFLVEEARWLIGFWFNKGTTQPSKQPGFWMRRATGPEAERFKTGGSGPTNWWGEAIRERIARQVEAIRHWQIHEYSYENAPDVPATWFVDPPYAGRAGRYYREKFTDYARLAEWSKSRQGQVIVCEQEGADWLPFRPFRNIKALDGKHGRKHSAEVIWTNP